MTTNASFEVCTEGTMQYVCFLLLASWVNIILVKCIHVVVYRYSWLIFFALQPFIIWLRLNLFTHSTNWHVSCTLGLFWIILQEHAGLLLHSICFSIGYLLQSGIAGSSNKYMLNFSGICERLLMTIVVIYTLSSSVWKFHLLDILDNTWYCQFYFILAF